MKVAVAMSGGVDSSVAAALMAEKYGKKNVFGITARLFCYNEGSIGPKACCSLEAIDDAKAVCRKLQISHYVINEEMEFEKAVIKKFIEAYKNGQTPIPCVPCNAEIKFGSMLKKAKGFGADKLATGHYARILPPAVFAEKKKNSHQPAFQLARGVDKKKDQSYFLWGLSQLQLGQIEFPVGELTKEKVRKIAKKIDLKTAQKKESQGVCFIAEGRVTDFLVKKIRAKKGNIVSSRGEVVGSHDGYFFYTVGQRKGLGGGHKNPIFVIGLDPEKNEVIVGGSDELYKKNLNFSSANWINRIDFPLQCTARIRYNMEDEKCLVLGIENKLKEGACGRNITFSKSHEVKFKKSQRAITPGQSIVFYDGDICLGGGIIKTADNY